MLAEPSMRRAIAFFDGQNLFFAAKESFGYTYPNYDPKKLAKAVCDSEGWELEQTRFYTGVPATGNNARWSAFWAKKLGQMGRQGVWIYQRPLSYQNKTVQLPDGTRHTYLAAHEKGIDVRIALDIVTLALDGAYDVALVFSQDQDLSEVADEIRRISSREKRWIKIACAYPTSPASRNLRGIDRTDWVKIDRPTYDRCLDPRDYRSKKPPSP